jgi:CheY-like chemotaxis protein
LGFDVNTSTNGLEGLKDLQTDVFDIVFCDFLMPAMDGLDCVQQYRDWEAIHRPWIHQYIVGISAHASQNDIEKGLSAGMDDFKAKPITLQVLKELEGSSELKQVSTVLDSVLDPGKHGAEPNGAAQDGEKLHVDKRVKKNDGPVCLVGEDAPNVSKSMSKIMEDKHWNPVIVNDGEDALRLLKMRNWDAVFLDEEMPRLDGIRVIERFREWEKNHRVARQKNVILISQSFVPNPNNGNVSVAYPAGFDGALGKPILPADLIKLLDMALFSIRASSDACDIVAR